MQKSDLIRTVSERTGNTQKDTKEMFDVMTQVIMETVANGDRVTIPGFGTFETRERSARQGVNPQTREPITIPAARTAGFTPGSHFKTAVRDGRMPVEAEPV